MHHAVCGIFGAPTFRAQHRNARDTRITLSQTFPSLPLYCMSLGRSRRLAVFAVTLTLYA